MQAFRGELLHFLADPAVAAAAHEYFADGLLLVDEGKVVALGPWAALHGQLGEAVEVVDYSGYLLLPGFVDTHVHYPQSDVIASYGEQLLGWLEKYTFPCERRFADEAFAESEARFFLHELIAAGTTTAMSFATVHPASVTAFFRVAEQLKLRMITGKVLMDSHCPAYLADTADQGLAESCALIERWHGVDRLRYAVTPRFALTSSAQQMASAGQLFRRYPGLHLQSHVAENRSEVARVAALYPDASSYLDVYARFGQLGERSVFAHCLWLDDTDRQAMGRHGAAMAFCPTSNLFLGSGLFDLARADACGVRVGIGSDVGGGTRLSLLATLADAYKVLQLQGQTLTAERAFYLATLGGARALYLDDFIGNFVVGKEADFVVLNLRATLMLAKRMAATQTLSERLFALMMLGDERCTHATHILGQALYQQTAPVHPMAARSSPWQ